MYRVLVILLSGILILPGVVNAEVKSESLKFILEKLTFGGRVATGANLTRIARQKQLAERLLRYSEEQILSRSNISKLDYRFLVSTTSERELLVDFFDPKVLDELAEQMPKLKLLWKSKQRLSLMKVIQQCPRIYPTVPLELYKRDPGGYMRLLATNRTSVELTIDDLKMHLRSLLMDQAEQDLLELVTSAISNSTKYRQTNLRGSLHEFLSSAKVKEETRRRAASAIYTKWSIENNSLLSLVVSRDISLRQTYDLSKVSAASAVAGGGWASYITMEEFVGPKFVDQKLKMVASPNIESIAVPEFRVIPDDDPLSKLKTNAPNEPMHWTLRRLATSPRIE